MELTTNNREIRNAIWGSFVIMWEHGVHLRRYKIATTTKSLWILSSFLCLLVSSSESKEGKRFIVLKFRFSIPNYNPYRPRMASKWFVFKAYWYHKKRCQRTEWGAGWCARLKHKTQFPPSVNFTSPVLQADFFSR